MTDRLSSGVPRWRADAVAVWLARVALLGVLLLASPGCGAESSPKPSEQALGRLSIAELLALVADDQGPVAGSRVLSELEVRGTPVVREVTSCLPAISGPSLEVALVFLARRVTVLVVPEVSLLAALKDESAETRSAAIGYLRQSSQDSDALMLAVRGLLQDPDSMVRFRAASLLKRRSGGQLAHLLEVLKKGELPPDTIESVSWALVIGDDELSGADLEQVRAGITAALSNARSDEHRANLRRHAEVLEMRQVNKAATGR